MRTSETISGYEDLTGEPGSSLGAGAISGKSRPRTGVCLLEPVQTVSNGGDVAVQSLLALDGGVQASVRFTSPYPLAKGMYYDVEVRSKDGDGAFLQVERMPSGRSLENVPTDFFVSTVFSSQGRFGAYGTPADVSVVKSEMKGGTRYVDIGFSALTPNGSEQRRHAVVAAVMPQGSEDCVMLVGGTTELRWKKGKSQEAIRGMLDTLTVDNTRQTKIPRTIQSDYRYSEGTLFQ